MINLRIFKNKKTIYLLVLSIITLLAFVVSPTYAKFISGYVTDEDIVELDLSFDVSITDIEEYHELEIASGGVKRFNVQIDNDSEDLIYYGVWYKMISPSEITDEISIGKLEGTVETTSGSIDGNGKKVVTIGIVNNSSENIKLYIGVASSIISTEDIEYLNKKHLISGTIEVPEPLTEYVKNLYNDGNEITEILSSSGNKLSLNIAQSIMIDDFEGYRYYGENPNNYVLYNNELWRIISVSKVYKDLNDTKGEERVKIVKSTPLTSVKGMTKYSYDSSIETVNSGNGVNDWNKSDLMTELNSLYFNSTSGNCYTNPINTFENCDFTNLGLNEEARNLVDDALYYLGGIKEEYSDVTNLKLNSTNVYEQERGTVVYNCDTEDCGGKRENTWTGKIGLMYLSDYVYATDITRCIGINYLYEEESVCYENNWLRDLENQYTMTPFSYYSDSVIFINKNGTIPINNTKVPEAVSTPMIVRPTLYLKSNVVVTGGKGTSMEPYNISIIKIENDFDLQ